MTRYQCEEVTRIYLRRLDYKVYGSAFKKSRRKIARSTQEPVGKKLRRIVVIEKSKRGYWHIHLCLELPEPSRISKADFIQLMTTVWQKMHQRHGLPKIKDAPTPEGWVRYLGKLDQKSGLDSWADHIAIGSAGPWWENYQGRMDAALNPDASIKSLVA